MSISPRKLLLKVFSGPHVGAEVLLAEGEHVLGSDEDCDVILNDRLIAARHIRITVQGKDVRFESIGDSRVFIDGDEVASALLEPFQYFTVGNTHLAIGPSDAEWPNHDFPGYQLVTRSPAEAPESRPDETGDESGVDGPESADGQSDAVAASAESANATPRPDGEDSAPRDSRWRWIILASVIFVMLCIGVTVFVEGLAGGQAGPSPSLTLAELESAIAAASDAESSAVTVAQQDGYFLVEGYVADFSARQQIENAVYDLLDRYPEDGVEVRVLDTQGLASSAQNVLNMYARGRPSLGALEVTAAAPGQVAVSGVVARLDDWTPVRDAIRRDVRAIQSLDDSQVRTPGQAPRVRPGTQQAVGTVAAAEPVVDGNPGPMSPPPQPGPGFEPAPSTATEQVADNTGEAVPRLSVVRVAGGRRRLMTMADGSIVFEGGTVAGGYVVESIQSDQIILSRNGTKLSIRIGATP